MKWAYTFQERWRDLCFAPHLGDQVSIPTSRSLRSNLVGLRFQVYSKVFVARLVFSSNLENFSSLLVFCFVLPVYLDQWPERRTIPQNTKRTEKVSSRGRGSNLWLSARFQFTQHEQFVASPLLLEYCPMHILHPTQHVERWSKHSLAGAPSFIFRKWRTVILGLV